VLIDERVRRLIREAVRRVGSQRQLGIALGYGKRWAGSQVSAMLRGRMRSMDRRAYERLLRIVRACGARGRRRAP